MPLRSPFLHAFVGFSHVKILNMFSMQALKNNPESMPPHMSLSNNYIGNSGRVALREALEDIFEIYEIEMELAL